MDKPRVGVLTTFYNWDRAYSLCSVVEAQLTALVRWGYNPILFVHDNFKDDDKVPSGVEIRKTVPRFLLIDYSGHQEVSKDLVNQTSEAYQALKKTTEDIDIIIEHDMIFQGWFLPYCLAIHKLAGESKIKWFHWIHSVPSERPANLSYPHNLRYELPQNSKLVYLNNVHSLRAAEAYGIFPKDVRVVYNALDPRLFWGFHPLVNTLIERYDILGADFLQVYPVSTPRMIDGKGLKTLIEIFAELKLMGKKVALVICNAHANDKREKQVIAETLSIAAEKGLGGNEVIFTSLEQEPAYELGVPREVVSQLFHLSNLFIFPSYSENCSLILLEAMLSKNLLILNNNVPAMREFGKENAFYFDFGGIGAEVSYTDRKKYMNDVAKIIISEFNQNRPLKAQNQIKQFFNYDWIFKNQIEPLFYEQ